MTTYPGVLGVALYCKRGLRPTLKTSVNKGLKKRIFCRPTEYFCTQSASKHSVLADNDLKLKRYLSTISCWVQMDQVCYGFLQICQLANVRFPASDRSP